MLLRRRKLNRLKNYDYSWGGLYFVTICTKNRECHFGDIVDGEMQLNSVGEIVEKIWSSIPKHFNGIQLDAWTIMPNHVHGIFGINKIGVVGVADLRPLQTMNGRELPRNKMLLSKTIHGFKSTVTREINNRQSDFEFSWQRSFHDHIIRNEKSLQKIREYIINNPAKWAEDSNNPALIKKI